MADLRRRAATRLAAVPYRVPTDYLGMVVGFCLILLVAVVNSRGRIFWEDEVLAWVLLRDPSWHHMIHAWNLGADGGGFTFYVLGRFWFGLFGASEIAFRLFSATCFGLAFVVLWNILRRSYPVWIVGFATFNTMFFSPPLTMHYVEGRFYGLLVLSTALAFWLVVRLGDVSEPLPRRFALLAFAIHSVLVTSHVLGVLYSAVLLLAMVVVDRLRGRRRAWLYVGAASSWLWLIPERTALWATSRVGLPHFWTKAPNLGQVIGAYSGSSLEILLVLLLLSLGVALTLPRELGAMQSVVKQALRARLPLYVGAGCLLMTPLLLLAEGSVGTWLFVDRYLQPVSLAVAWLTAELVFVAVNGSALPDLCRMRPRVTRAAFTLLSFSFGGWLLFWVFHHMASYTPAVADFTTTLTEQLPRDLPVVVGDAFTFTGLMSRQAESGVPFVFLLDWRYALSDQAPRLEVTQYHLMENWKRADIYPGHVAYAEQFLRDHERFLVVDNQPLGPASSKRPEVGNPLAERLAVTPGFEVQRYFTLDRLYKDSQRDTIWLVCRGSCRAYPRHPGPDYCTIERGGQTRCEPAQKSR